MEGGGGSTRLGSSRSSRHGPATVFSGPVRRWKKTWAHIPSSNPSPVASKVSLYKWTPVPPPTTSGGKEENSEESNGRSVRYLPLSVVLAQRKEATTKAAEEAEATDPAQPKLAFQNDLNEKDDSEVEILPRTSDTQGSVQAGEDIQKLDTEDGAREHDSLDKIEHVPSDNGHGAAEVKSIDIEMQEEEPEKGNTNVGVPKPISANAEIDSRSGFGNVRDGQG